MAAEFFDRLIRHRGIRNNLKLRDLLLKESNFESALHTARTEGFDAGDVRDFERAILDVFHEHDRAIHKARFSGQTDINIYGVQEFVSRFCERTARVDAGFVFTLNQDLFLERKYYSYSCYFNAPRPTLPGVSPHRDWFQTHFDDSYSDLPPDYVRTVP
ncbi:MAG: hypothetical protein ACREDR_37580, partial [Blastocatellia bacterium]